MTEDSRQDLFLYHHLASPARPAALWPAIGSRGPGAAGVGEASGEKPRWSRLGGERRSVYGFTHIVNHCLSDIRLPLLATSRHERGWSKHDQANLNYTP